MATLCTVHLRLKETTEQYISGSSYPEQYTVGRNDMHMVAIVQQMVLGKVGYYTC